MRRAIQYGVGSPGVLLGLVTVVVAQSAATMMTLIVLRAAAIGVAMLLMNVYYAFVLTTFAHTMLAGRFRLWDSRLSGLRLAGGENILDLGCGRGLVLVKAAHRLTTGTVTGVDRASRGLCAALANARREGVSDRVAVVTAARDLPFADATFDVVLSSLFLHTVRDDHDGVLGGIGMVGEAYRVLKPGGRLVLVDYRHAGIHADRLSAWGAAEVTMYDPGWTFHFGRAGFTTRVVTAVKPQNRAMAT